MRRTIKATRRRLPEVTLTTGALVIAAAIPHGTPGEAAAGVALVAVGAIAQARRAAERSIRDTRRERDRLDALVKEATAKHHQYIAAKAHVDREREQLCEQMAENERRTTARLAAERVVMRAKIEEEREEMLAEIDNMRSLIKREGYLVGLDHGNRGIIFGPTQAVPGAVVIQMPRANREPDASTAGRGGHLS